MAVIPMPAADGNCMFHALAYPHGNHHTVRARVVQHVRDRWALYQPFVPTAERATYLRDMSQSGTWGDELMLQAFSSAAEIPVCVHDRQSPDVVLSSYGIGTWPAIKTRHLLFDGVHYDVLE